MNVNKMENGENNFPNDKIVNKNTKKAFLKKQFRVSESQFKASKRRWMSRSDFNCYLLPESVNLVCYLRNFVRDKLLFVQSSSVAISMSFFHQKLEFLE